MTDPFETIAFLANSENRVRILEALADGPQSRADLAEETGVARATLGRILTDLEDRGWIRRNSSRYELTPHGTHLVEAFGSMVDTVEALAELDDLVQWFPFDDVSFDLDQLCGARITRTSKHDGLRPVTRSLSMIREANHIRLVASQHAPPALEAMWETTVEEERQRLELVLTEGVIESILDTAHDTKRLRDIVASERAAVYCTPTPRSYNCVANDDTILFALSDHNGAPQALVESENSEILRWFDSFFERARQEATRLTVEDLSE